MSAELEASGALGVAQALAFRSVARSLVMCVSVKFPILKRVTQLYSHVILQVGCEYIKKLMCIFNGKIFRVFPDRQREASRASVGSRTDPRGFGFSHLSASPGLKNMQSAIGFLFRFILSCIRAFIRFASIPPLGSCSCVCGTGTSKLRPSPRNTRSGGEGVW